MSYTEYETQITDNSEIFEGCAQPQEPPTATYTDKPKKTKIPFMIAFIFIVALIGGTYVFGYLPSTPEAGAKRFYNAMLNKNGTIAIANMYVPKNLTTAETEEFKKSITSVDLTKVVKSSLKISSAKPKSFSGTIQKSITLDDKTITDFKVVYGSLTVDGKTDTSAIYMVKQGKYMLVFDKWVVALG